MGRLKTARGCLGYFWLGCITGCLEMGVLFGSVCGFLLDAFMGLVGSLVGSGCVPGSMLVVSLVV